MLKVFGCIGVVAGPRVFKNKFQSNGSKGIFLGWKEGTKGFIMFLLETKEFVISRDVVYNENVFVNDAQRSSLFQTTKINGKQTSFPWQSMMGKIKASDLSNHHSKTKTRFMNVGNENDSDFDHPFFFQVFFSPTTS